MNLREAQLEARQRLSSDNAARDAELLLLHILQITKTQLLTNPTRELTSDELTHYNQLITRRLANEPIQYITGEQEFYGLPFRVTPAVLIPRPETELLVEALLNKLPHNQPVHIADVGTGSGCIAIALAANLPQTQLTALDLSTAALEVAKENAARNQVADRITFLQSDLLAAVPNQLFDVIASNPPYIPHVDAPTLHPQVREHEPRTALFADDNGLAIYRRLIPQVEQQLKPNGILALEIGYNQHKAIAAMLAGWQNITFLTDLNGIRRTALATRRS